MAPSGTVQLNGSVPYPFNLPSQFAVLTNDVHPKGCSCISTSRLRSSSLQSQSYRTLQLRANASSSFGLFNSFFSSEVVPHRCQDGGCVGSHYWSNNTEEQQQNQVTSSRI